MAAYGYVSGLTAAFNTATTYGENVCEEVVVENVNGKGGDKYVKASFWERFRIKKAKITELKPNPLDEFSNHNIGPNESAVSKYIKEINTNGTISEPIEVQKLADGGYEIVNGHHRWLAAKKIGLNEVPIKIVNYKNFDNYRN